MNPTHLSDKEHLKLQPTQNDQGTALMEPKPGFHTQNFQPKTFLAEGGTKSANVRMNLSGWSLPETRGLPTVANNNLASATQATSFQSDGNSSFVSFMSSIFTYMMEENKSLKENIKELVDENKRLRSQFPCDMQEWSKRRQIDADLEKFGQRELDKSRRRGSSSDESVARARRSRSKNKGRKREPRSKRSSSGTSLSSVSTDRSLKRGRVTNRRSSERSFSKDGQPKRPVGECQKLETTGVDLKHNTTEYERSKSSQSQRSFTHSGTYPNMHRKPWQKKSYYKSGFPRWSCPNLKPQHHRFKSDAGESQPTLPEEDNTTLPRFNPSYKPREDQK